MISEHESGLASSVFDGGGSANGGLGFVFLEPNEVGLDQCDHGFTKEVAGVAIFWLYDSRTASGDLGAAFAENLDRGLVI